METVGTRINRSMTSESQTSTRIIAPAYIAFPIVQQGRHSRRVITALNTVTMHSLLSLPHHRWKSRHSSGPEWIDTPYSLKDLASFILFNLTSYLTPVLTGAFRTSLVSGSSLRTAPFGKGKWKSSLLNSGDDISLYTSV